MLPWLALYVAVFTLFHLLRQGGNALTSDMLENYAWGIAWQAGYFQHPPLFAWVTAGWFSLFPREHWAYFLLSALNSCAALVIIARIARRYLAPDKVSIAVLSLTLVPFYFSHAYKYNANVALLPLWPATVWLYLRVLERERLGDAAILGVVAAAAMLTKYYSALLLLAVLGHGIFDQAARRLIRGPLYLVAVASFLLVMGPHVLWLIDNDFMTFARVADRIALDRGRWELFARQLVEFVLAPPIYFAIPIALVLLFRRLYPDGRCRSLSDTFKALRGSKEGRLLIWVSVAPYLLSIAYCVGSSSIAHTNWLIPAGFGWTILVVALFPDWHGDRAGRPFFVALVLSWLVLLAAAAFVESRRATPVLEIVDAATATWEERYSEPLRIVGGTKDYANAVAFYAEHPPSVVQEVSLRLTPWIRSEDLRRDGALFICDGRDVHCAGNVGKLIPAPRPAGSVHIGDHAGHAEEDQVRVVFFVIPPADRR